MRIREFIPEQTIGSVGSTSGVPAPVQPVSQTPPVTKPAGPGTPAAGTDPNMQKLAATLKQNNIVHNDRDINNFVGALQANQTGKALNPDQLKAMAGLGPALLKNKTLGPALDTQLKAMSQQKPGTPPTPMGQTPVQQQKAPGGM